MKTVEFTIPFVAVQKRARKGKRGWYAPSSKDQQIIAQIALVARVEANLQPFQNDCHVTLTCLGFNGKDLDNAIKICLDSFNGVIWNDDDQVVLIIARKIRIGEPRMEVSVSEVP